MSETSYLWNTDGTGDGASEYNRGHWARIAEILAACSGFEGVAPGYLNELAATVGGANTVNINTGGAVVDGKPYLSDASEAVNIPSAVGGGNTRIDVIVLRADWTAQTVRITRIEGTNAASPTPPAITQNSGTTYDVVLCEALVNTSGAVTVTETGKKVWAAPHVDGSTVEVNGSTGALRVKNDGIDDTKVGNRVPQFYRRQGGSATNWSTGGSAGGSTAYTPGAVRMQAGSYEISFGPADYNFADPITFPVAFSNAPLVFVTLTNLEINSPDDGDMLMAYAESITANGFWLWIRRPTTGVTNQGVRAHWLAIGPE